VGRHPHQEPLDVQHELRHVLDDAVDRGELVLDARDLHVRDRGALEGGEEHAAQAVADRRAEAALEGLGDEQAVSLVAPALVEDDAVRELESPPADAHLVGPPSAGSDRRLATKGSGNVTAARQREHTSTTNSSLMSNGTSARLGSETTSP